MSVQVPAVIEDGARHSIIQMLENEQSNNVNPLLVKGQCLRMLDWLVGRIEYEKTIIVDTDIRVGHARLVCNQLRRSHANVPMDPSVKARVAEVMRAVDRAPDEQIVLSIITARLASSSVK